LGYLYFDESGDLGLTERSSKYLVLACVYFNNVTDADRLIRKVRSMLKAKKQPAEFKFSHSNRHTRELLLKETAKFSQLVNYSVVFKDSPNIKTYYQNKPLELYATLFWKCFSLFVSSIGTTQLTTQLILDKLLSKSEFNRLATMVKSLGNLKISEQKNSLGIEFQSKKFILIQASSSSCGGLQVADFVAGAIRRSYEGEKHYMQLFQDKINRAYELK